MSESLDELLGAVPGFAALLGVSERTVSALRNAHSHPSAVLQRFTPLLLLR